MSHRNNEICDCDELLMLLFISDKKNCYVILAMFMWSFDVVSQLLHKTLEKYSSYNKS